MSVKKLKIGNEASTKGNTGKSAAKTNVKNNYALSNVQKIGVVKKLSSSNTVDPTSSLKNSILSVTANAHFNKKHERGSFSSVG